MGKADPLGELLSARGLRRTAVRRSALSFLAAKARPLSHAELHRLTGPTFDRVTLYRTLETLHEAGLLHKVLGEDGVWRYCSHEPDSPACPANHPHFLCLRCGRMVCLPGQALPRVQVPPRCVVKGKQLVVFGYCPSCGPGRSSS